MQLHERVTLKKKNKKFMYTCDRDHKLRRGKGGDAEKVHTIKNIIVVTRFINNLQDFGTILRSTV